MSQISLATFDEFRELCNRMKNIVRRQIDYNKSVWIFGAGQFGRDVCAALLGEGFDVQGFIESKPRTEKVMGLPVVPWSQVDATHLGSQLAIGIFNRGMPLNELGGIARAAGFTNILMPWDLYSALGQSLGWRFWLSSPGFIIDNLAEIEKTYFGLSDEISRRCLLAICAFRMGQNNSYADFTHPENQYFNDLTIDPLPDDGIRYVDGGAYNGDTFLELLSKIKITEAYLFEPDPENFAMLTAVLKKIPNPAISIPLALTDCYSILSFGGGNGEGGSISEKGALHIATVGLDNIMPRQIVDFIKLDIEGAEVLALNGGRELIERSRPILAISLYHRPSDIWEIQKTLSYLQNYSFYIRQHCYNSFDSVMYAIPG